MTLKHPGNLSQAKQKALTVVREQIPQLAVAYDFNERFFGIYDEPDKYNAQNAFEAWENRLPAQGLELWLRPSTTIMRTSLPTGILHPQSRIPIPKTEGLNGLIKMSNYLGCGYSYDIIRAKTLYSAEDRKVGSAIR